MNRGGEYRLARIGETLVVGDIADIRVDRIHNLSGRRDERDCLAEEWTTRISSMHRLAEVPNNEVRVPKRQDRVKIVVRNKDAQMHPRAIVGARRRRGVGLFRCPITKWRPGYRPAQDPRAVELRDQSLQDLIRVPHAPEIARAEQFAGGFGGDTLRVPEWEQCRSSHVVSVHCPGCADGSEKRHHTKSQQKTQPKR